MAIVYNIYGNDGAGGPVDYTKRLASTSALTYVSGHLASGSDTTFAVRAQDTSTNLEEANTDAIVRIVLDASGVDVSRRPNPPHALALSSAVGGGCLLTWAYGPAVRCGTPTGFQVFLTPGSTVLYDSPTVTVPYVSGQVGYTCALAGPHTLGIYSGAVRAYNSAGSDGSTTSVSETLGIPTVPLSMDPVVVTFV